MAKPKHGRWNGSSRQSSPSSDLHPDHPHRHPREHAFSRSLPRSPSPAILAALAIIATTSPVVADIFITPPPTATPSSSTSSPTPTLQPLAKRLVIADRYVEDSDGLWQKTNQWTLYGSTCCSSSTTQSTSSTPSQPSSSQSPMPTSTSTSDEAVFDTSTLPAGWDTTDSTSHGTGSTIILALAIVLAVSICVFIIGCLVWRRRKKRARDVERKFGKKLSAADDSQDNVQEKDTRDKMRMWARASARWKSNIRQSARRRRKRPLSSSIVNRPTSPLHCDSQVSVDAQSTPSRRGSFAAEEPDTPRLDAILSPDDGVTGTPAVQPDPPRPVSPPTYGASFVPRFSHLPPSSAVTNPSPAPPPDRPSSAQHSNHPSLIEEELLPYVPPTDGHVATDDKVELTRIRDLASSPPTMSDPATSAGTTPSVSAPEWHEVEDDLEDLGVDLSEAPMSPRNFGFPPSFPPPPSKADIPFRRLDDHPLGYGERDDILASLPTPGKSESSFEASPSAPPIDYPGLEPSAPSLEGEDDLFQDWDGASYIPEVASSVDQDFTLARETGSSTISSTSPTSFSRSRGSAVRDSILPQYHP